MSVVRWWPMLVGLAAQAACTSEDPCSGPGTVCRIAGNDELGFNGDGHDAVDTALFHPSQVRRGPDGLIYLMDFDNMRLRRIESDGTMSTIAGEGTHANAAIGFDALRSALENPIDFDFLSDGRVVFVSYHDPRVLMIDFDGTLQLIAGGLAGSIGNEGDGGPATLARFVEVAGIAVAPDGAIYVADEKANRVRVIRDGVIDTLAGTGVPGFEGDGGSARTARLSRPSALAVDAAGNVLIADSGNCAVRRVAPDATIATVVGTGRQGFAGDGGAAVDAVLAHVQGIAVASDGTLYIGDRLNNRIRRVTPDGVITTMAGTGDNVAAGDGGSALDASFGYLGRVQLDTDGGLLVADQTGNAIRKILPPL